MRYDFTSVIDRRGTDSYKWNVPEGDLPMWVADMDFRTAPEILEAVTARIRHGVFGYSVVPERWYRAYSDWWDRRHSFRLDPEWLIFCTGVVPALSSSVRKLTSPGDRVLILPPVYNIFWNSIVNNGCEVVENPLIYENGSYRMDLEDLDRKLSDPLVRVMILCNPHNPVGKIWDRATLAAVGELASRHGVTVLSDEIHCDLTLPGKEYIPFASVSEVCREISVSCLAPTKAFNLAGIQTAAVSVPNPELRKKICRALNTDEVAEPNAIACPAAIAAFERGAEWLDELRSVLWTNRTTAEEVIRTEMPALSAPHAEATYLLWVSTAGTGKSGEQFSRELRNATGLFVTPGNVYGSQGMDWFRMNLACPASVLEDGLDRLRSFVRSLN
ncbi:MAG: pyridoxal phosphate-dependent aminotransferase [Clostridia bacterium]|nr:pyridoxal phosphate-dependent aminotransferase [Clostridia bacterium]